MLIRGKRNEMQIWTKIERMERNSGRYFSTSIKKAYHINVCQSECAISFSCLLSICLYLRPTLSILIWMFVICLYVYLCMLVWLLTCFSCLLSWPFCPARPVLSIPLPSICLSLYKFISQFSLPSVCLPVWLFICLSVIIPSDGLPLSLSIISPIYPFAFCLSICFEVYDPVRLTLSLSTCLPVSLPVCPEEAAWPGCWARFLFSTSSICK